MEDLSLMFSQGKIGSMAVPNRIVRSATFDALGWRQVPEEVVSFYETIARGGSGLIVTGAIPVVPDAQAFADYTPAEFAIDGISRVPAAVHRAVPGCRIVAQVYAEPALGPSEMTTPFLGPIHGLTQAEIAHLVRCFVESIDVLKQAGFDGVQLHAAHGSTCLWSFLSPYTNRRTDDYGGSAHDRARIIREIISQARDRVGEFPILIKVNCTDDLEVGTQIETFPAQARAVADCGVDAIEISGGSTDALTRTREELGYPPIPLSEARTGIHGQDEQSYFLPAAERTDLDIPLILVGGNRNAVHLEEVLRDGITDFVAMCRPLLCEPDLPEKWRADATASPRCISCNSCVYSVLADNPDRGYGMPVCIYREDRDLHRKAQQWLRDWTRVHRHDSE